MLSSADWFYSDLNRRLIAEFYKKHGLAPSLDIEKKFNIYDRHRKVKFAAPGAPPASSRADGLRDAATSINY